MHENIPVVKPEDSQLPDSQTGYDGNPSSGDNTPETKPEDWNLASDDSKED